MNRLSHRLSSERHAIRICLVIALAFAALAIREWRNDALPAFGQRGWGPLRAMLFDQFGPAGLAAPWCVLAVAMIAVARLIWRHADRVPGDRWYRR